MGKKGKIKTTALLLASAVFLFAWMGGKTAVERAAAEGCPYGWARISSYCTYFNAEEKDRCKNIAIAAELIDGATIQAYGEPT